MDAKSVAAFARGMIARIDELGTKHPVLASLSIGEMTGNDIPAPAPFHPAANQIYKALAN